MQDIPDVPQYLRPAEACDLLRCGRTYLYKLSRAGRLTAHRPSTRVTLYRRDEIEALIEASSKPAEAAAQ